MRGERGRRGSKGKERVSVIFRTVKEMRVKE